MISMGFCLNSYHAVRYVSVKGVADLLHTVLAQ